MRRNWNSSHFCPRALQKSHPIKIINKYYITLHYNYNRFSTLCPGQPRWVGTRSINHSGFCWSKDDGVAVASAEPYASYLHFAPEDNHVGTPSLRFSRPDALPDTQPTHQSTEGNKLSIHNQQKITPAFADNKNNKKNSTFTGNWCNITGQ